MLSQKIIEGVKELTDSEYGLFMLKKLIQKYRLVPINQIYDKLYTSLKFEFHKKPRTQLDFQKMLLSKNIQKFMISAQKRDLKQHSKEEIAKPVAGPVAKKESLAKNAAAEPERKA